LKCEIMILGLVYTSLLMGPAFAGDDNDIYHNEYAMCTAIVVNQYKAVVISPAEKSNAIQNCLSNVTRYF